MHRRRVVMLVIALAGALVIPASADRDSGRLLGQVTDTSGEALPGVTVTVTLVDGGQSKLFVTRSFGFYYFSELFPGMYELVAQLDGFSTVGYPNVNVQIGKDTKIRIELSPAVEETIMVTSESPLIDEIKMLLGLIADAFRLEKVPSARDAGAIATQAAGVIADRANAGGGESGELPRFVGGGSARSENTYLLDGVVVTDPTDAGGSLLPTYGFESLKEVQATTGGAEIENSASGVLVALATLFGTNDWRGSGQYFWADDSLQADPPSFPAPGPVAPRARDDEEAVARGDQIAEIERFGLELGGSLIRDHVWIWGSYGGDEIAHRSLGGGLERAESEGWSVKLSSQPTDAMSVVGFFVDRDRVTSGRGSVPVRAPETTWDEVVAAELWKTEVTYVAESLFDLPVTMTGRLGGVSNATGRLPRAGVDGAETIRDRLGIFRESFLASSVERASIQSEVGAATFFDLGRWTHDLRFGASYRRARASSMESWPGRGVIHQQGESFGIPGMTEVATVTRDGALSAQAEYRAFWAQDVVSDGRFTFNLGLRLDLQDGDNRASSTPASRLLPELLPAVDFAGNDGGGFRWATLAPRLAVTYTLREDGPTLLRASYARFAEQLALPAITRVNPTAPARADFFFDDRDGDGLAQESELFPEPFFCDRCADPEITHRTDADLSSALTDELLVGLEHALRPEWVISVIGSYRRVSDIADERLLIVDENGVLRTATASDFVFDRTVSGALPDGGAYAVPSFALRDGLRPTGGTLLTTGGREQEYLGVTLNLSKRLSEGWSMEGNLTLSDWTWSVPSSFAGADDPTDDVSPDDDDGAIVAQSAVRTAGEDGLWLSSRWSGHLSGVYQVAPSRWWGFDLGFSLSAREGYPNPYFAPVVGSDGLLRRVAVSEFGQGRLDAVATIDLHLDKEFHFELFSESFTATVAVEAFNLLHDGVVLRRERNLAVARAGTATETLNPRVFQIGLRLAFGSGP